MNIVQEFYEDFIKPKAKVPRFRKKRMDDVINKPADQAQETPPQELGQASAETVTEEAQAEEVAKPAKDPSFNCAGCAGEGLTPQGNICADCKGTGKV